MCACSPWYLLKFNAKYKLIATNQKQLTKWTSFLNLYRALHIMTDDSKLVGTYLLQGIKW